MDHVLQLLDSGESNGRRSQTFVPVTAMVRAAPDAVRRRGGRRERPSSADSNEFMAQNEPLATIAIATLEKLTRGVLLLDRQGRVRFMNRPARAMLHRGHGMTVRSGRLSFASLLANAEFERCLAQRSGNALLKVHGPNPAHGEYRVLLSALDGTGANAGFCVFIHEPPGKQRPLPPRVLRDLYGLSAAEGRLVNALFVGQSLQAAAATVGVSIHTAKSVLKRVFVKCEVGTQAALLQLLSLGPRAL